MRPERERGAPVQQHDTSDKGADDARNESSQTHPPADDREVEVAEGVHSSSSSSSTRASTAVTQPYDIHIRLR